MKNRFTCAMLATAALLPVASHALTPEELFRQASPAVWVVLARDDNARVIGSGSAVVVSPGRVITNCHVLRQATSITLRRDREETPARLEFPDPERDLCQLKADRLPAVSQNIAPIASLRVGQKVYAIGAPRGLEQSLSDGLISSLRRDPAGELEYIQITAPISPGSSGGGLFDDQGRLIGITTAIIGGGAQNLNFARPAEWIRAIPERGLLAMTRFNQDGASRTAASGARPATPTLPALVVNPDTPSRAVVVPTEVARSGSGPAAIPPSPGSNAAGAEQFAKRQRCTTEPKATLVGKGAAEETFSVPCESGYALILRCMAGNCEEIK